MANKKDLTFGLGENWRFTVRCFKADGTTRLDLTGASIQVGIKSRDASLLVTSPDGATILTEDDASLPYRLFVNITETIQQGAALTPGEYDYTVRVILTNGIADDQLFGVLHIRDTSPLT